MIDKLVNNKFNKIKRPKNFTSNQMMMVVTVYPGIQEETITFRLKILYSTIIMII